MARIKYSTLVNTISGSLSGTIFSICKGVNYIKTRRPKIFNRRTLYQQRSRGIINTLSGIWYSLPNSYKLLWNSFATLLKRPMTGLNAFIRLNLPLAMFLNCTNNQSVSGIKWEDLGQQFGQTAILSLIYVNNGILLAGTYPDGKILRSTNYGLTWSDLGQQFSQTSINCLLYVGNSTVLAGTSPDGKILRSTNLGLNWSDCGQQDSETGILSLALHRSSVLFAGSTPNGKIFKSENDGQIWSSMGQQFGQTSIHSICSTDRRRTLAGTYPDGKILRCNITDTDWDDLGQKANSTIIKCLVYVKSNIFMAGTGENGKIIRSTNTGSSWTTVYSDSSEGTINCLCDCGNGLFLAGTNNNAHILRSVDYGVTWVTLGQQASETSINSLAYTDSLFAFAGTSENGKILKSPPEDYLILLPPSSADSPPYPKNLFFTALDNGFYCISWTSPSLTTVFMINQYSVLPGRSDSTIQRFKTGNISSCVDLLGIISTNIVDPYFIRFRSRTIDLFGRLSPWATPTVPPVYPPNTYGFAAYGYDYYGK